MTLYRYAGNCPVDEVRFVTTANGGVRAYVHARPGADETVLDNIVTELDKEGVQAVPGTYQGVPVLEVRRISSQKQLQKKLEDVGAVDKKPEVIKTPDDNISFMDMLKKRTLQASGLAYLVGDACFMKYGYEEGHKEDFAAGVMYFLGTASLLAFGKNDQSDIKLRELSENMQQYLANQNIATPQGCSLEHITEPANQSLQTKLYDFGRHYPAEMMNTFFGFAGALIARSAYKYHVSSEPKPGMDAHAIKQMRREGWRDVGLGTMTMASGAISTLVKEKKRDPDEPPAKGFARLWQLVQEKPLRVAGIGYIISTLCHFSSTEIALAEAKRVGDKVRLNSVPYRRGFVIANLIAEALLAISSKGHGEGVLTDESITESVYSIAAELIMKQPAEQREQQIHNMAGFLQQPDVLAESYQTVDKNLRQKIAELEKNPWVCKTPPVQPAKASPMPEKPLAIMHPGAIQKSLAAQVPAIVT